MEEDANRRKGELHRRGDGEVKGARKVDDEKMRD